MSLPAGWTLIPCSGTYLNMDGNPAEGYVQFESAQVVTIDGRVVVPKRIGAKLDANGFFYVDLPSCNDPEISPQGWTYNVTEHLANGQGRSFVLYATFDGGAIDMASALPPIPLPTLVNLPDYAAEAEASAAAALTSATSAAASAAAAGLGSNIGYATKADMDADLAHAAGTLAVVTNDPTTANNNTYRKTGASGAGSWVASADTRLSAIAASFVAKSLLNIADPNVADPLLANTAAQLWRLYNTGTGSLSAASSSGLGTFAVLRKYPVAGGAQYTVSMHGAPTGWGFYFTSSPYISFYNADGSFHSQITSGFVNETGSAPTPSTQTSRQLTFTVPAGAARVGFNVRNAIDFANDNPATTASMQALVDNVMLNTGATAQAFSIYASPGSLAPDSTIFNLAKSGNLVVVLQAGFTFVRMKHQQSATEDIVWRLLCGQTPSYTSPGILGRTGVLDFWGARVIPRSTAQGNTVAAFNQSTKLWHAGTDERTPVHINGMYIGAGHGIIGYEITIAAGHDKNDIDVGSTWTDGAAKVWVLSKVVSTTKLFVIADNTGATDKWAISTNAPTGLTLTHASGATHPSAITFTSPSQGQLSPILQNLSLTQWLDNKQLTADGLYVGEDFGIYDLWDVPNAASLLSRLKSTVGSGTVDYTNAAISIQVSVSNAYKWNRWGAMTLFRTEHVKQAFKRSAGNPGDYSGAIQMQRLSRTIDSTPGVATSVWLYVPDIAPVSGYDLKNIANVTANAAFIHIPKVSCTDPANPASHFAMIGKDAGGAIVSGMAWGYGRKYGEGVPATHAAHTADVGYLSSANKFYQVFIDSNAGDAVAGDVYTVTAWRSYLDNSDPNLTQVVVYSAGGKEYAVITSHQAQSGKWVALPKELIGKPVSVLKADANVTVHSPTVQSRGVLMSFATSYGDVILEIG